MFQITTATKKIAKLKKRIRVVQGGSSASKTISIILYLIERAQLDEKPTVTSIVSESIPHLKRGAIRDFKRIMKEHKYWKDAGWNVQDSTYTFETGSIMEFFSTDNGDKLRGARRDRCFMNEANNCTFDAFEQLEIRTSELFFLDYNPTNEFWVHTEVVPKRNDVDFIILTYKDNEALDESIVDSLEQRMGRAGWWKVYGLGQLGEVEGKIYTDWKIIDEIPHEARLERYGLNFGYSSHPLALVALYYYNGGYIIDEIDYGLGRGNRIIADTILNQKKNVLTVADSAEPKSIDELKEFGVNIAPTEKGKDSVRFGIQVVQDQQISITKRSVNVIKEYRNYLWRADKNGKIIEPNEPEEPYHYSMDAVRYGITSLVPIKRRQEMIRNMPRMERKKQKNPAL
jgi:phage terminase large subunit